MLKSAELKREAEHCRELLGTATEPDLREQLKVWVRELDEQADADDLERALQALTNSPS